MPRQGRKVFEHITHGNIRHDAECPALTGAGRFYVDSFYVDKLWLGKAAELNDVGAAQRVPP
jgi:hypothetical protein